MLSKHIHSLTDVLITHPDTGTRASKSTPVRLPLEKHTQELWR